MHLPKPNIPPDHSIRNPVFRKLALGSCFNSAGWQGEQVILGLMVYQLTNSSAWVGIVLALNFAPMFFVGVPAGALADRFDRRSVLIRAEIVLTFSMLIFSLLLSQDIVGLSLVLAMSVISGIVRSVHHPARLSYAGDIAGSGGLVGTLSLLSILSRIGQLSGAMIAGFSSEYFSPAFAYLVLALAHLLAVFCFSGITSSRAGIERDGSVEITSTWAAIKDYGQVLLCSRLMMTLIILASLTEVFGFSFATAMPEIALTRLEAGADDLGIMHAFRNAGGLVAALVLAVLAVKRLGYLYLAVTAGFGLALLFMGQADDMTSVLFAVALVAVFASASDVLVLSMLQLSVPSELRGRAMGGWVVALGMGPIGHLELGWLIALLGTGPALYVNGFVMLLIGLIGLSLLPQVRTIRSG